MPSVPLVQRLRLICPAFLLVLAAAQNLYGFSKAGTVYTTNGSQSDVSAAIANASTGDTVNIPAGTFTWGTGGSSVSVDKAINLAGAGPTQTTINIAANGPTFGTGTINISAAAVVRDFKVVQAGSANTTAFTATTIDGWRITNIVYNSAATVGYFIYAGSYGLIDNCTVNTTVGYDEPIFGRGPNNSWTSASSMGTVNNVYVEDCTFTGPGYVCDFNSNARAVVRFCTIAGQNKVDGHGLASNSPARGVRHMEVYGNNWTVAAGYWTAIELRGGTGMVFDNISANNEGGGWFILKEYGSEYQWPNFSNTYQTPNNYPVKDQIGLGMDPKVSGSEPMYIWRNQQNGSDWALNFYVDLTNAIALYRTQTGNSSASFTMEDIIKADRDYYKQGTGTFTGSSGVGRGTKAQMLAITPTKTGVGFWVTNEAEWNSSSAGVDGQLYTWNGSAWVLKYTPYTYPHPLRVSGPPVAPSNAQVSILVQ